MEVEENQTRAEAQGLEEETFITNSWCGYDFISYVDIPNKRINTFFKIEPSTGGNLMIFTVTLASEYNIRNNYSFQCGFLERNFLSCDKVRIFYQLNGAGLETDLIIQNFLDSQQTKFYACTKNELEMF